MIQLLDEIDWQNILGPMHKFLGDFEYAVLLNEPAKQDIEDSFTKTQIMVKCSNSDNYYIFDNSGLVNMILSGEKVSDTNDEFNVARINRQALDISYYFINYMCDKFGEDYIKAKLQQTIELSSRIHFRITKLKYEIPYKELISILTQLDFNNPTNQEKTELKAKKQELITRTKLISKEIEDLKAFQEVQKAIITVLEDDLLYSRSR